jgi:hypothetical protein
MDSPARTTTASGQPETIPEERPASPGNDGEGRIKCPKCGWTPRARDRWSCTCRYLWNTFDTGGVCPGCLKQWTMTACLSCRQWSAHSDWYPKD